MIDILRDGPVATLTLRGIDRLTAHDLIFARQLRDAVRETADDDRVKALVLRSADDDFAPGACTPVPANPSSTAEAYGPAWEHLFCSPQGLYANLTFCKKFIVTAITGRCTGAGSLLVLGSDLTVASEDATFEAPFATLPEANLVLAALTLRLNRAKSWMLGDAPWSARQAAQAGLVNRVVSRAATQSTAMALARDAARMPLDGMAMTRILLEAFLDTQGVGQDFDHAPLHARGLAAAQARPSTPPGGAA